jgi:asparagine synthase (glutamine-hydrolysing)
MAEHLNGMFAFAIWDGRRQQLHLARDPYGVKPLFYQRDGDHFRFASEIKAILADERVERRLSAQALHDFLTFDYVPGAQTAFENIFEDDDRDRRKHSAQEVLGRVMAGQRIA